MSARIFNAWRAELCSGEADVARATSAKPAASVPLASSPAARSWQAFLLALVLQSNSGDRKLLALLWPPGFPQRDPQKRQRGDSNPCGQSPMDF